MKKLLVSAIIIASLSAPQASWASGTTATVSAQVSEVTSLDCSVVRCTSPAFDAPDTCDATPVPGNVMDFGTLVHAIPTDPNSALTSDHFFKVFCGINTSGRPYVVTQTGGPLSGSTTGARIPDNAWTFTPIPAVDSTDADTIANEPLSNFPGASIGLKVSADSTGALWLDTGANTNIVVIQAAYAITGDPRLDVDTSSETIGDLIPPNQPADTYAVPSTIQWTLTPR